MATPDDEVRGTDRVRTDRARTDDGLTGIPRPADEQVVYRVDPREEVVGTQHRGFDVLATIGGALAALGTFVLLSALVGAIVGSIGFQTGADDRDLSIGGYVAGLVVIVVACFVGGWVAGRMARRRGGLHGLGAVLWLVLLAGALAALAAVGSAKYDVRDKLGLPRWFNSHDLGLTALITGIVALLLALLAGYLGGRLGDRHHADTGVSLVETHRHVRERDGGIVGGPATTNGTVTGPAGTPTPGRTPTSTTSSTSTTPTTTSRRSDGGAR